tara:strand:- start:55 stop:459 length:405 start_codon:yes stop_codon:yes gene_type:complete
MKTTLILVTFLFLFLVSKINADEIKPLSELKINDPKNYTQNLMERCSVIYASLAILEDNNDYENKYKVFLQSFILSKKEANPDLDEEKLYKDSIEDFKLSLSFFLQLLKQNYNKEKSYLGNSWLIDDFNTCLKL